MPKNLKTAYIVMLGDIVKYSVISGIEMNEAFIFLSKFDVGPVPFFGSTYPIKQTIWKALYKIDV